MILGPDDFPPGFVLHRQDSSTGDMEVIGFFPSTFEVNQVALMLVVDGIHQKWVQN
jgi:hypothetical protein